MINTNQAFKWTFSFTRNIKDKKKNASKTKKQPEKVQLDIIQNWSSLLLWQIVVLKKERERKDWPFYKRDLTDKTRWNVRINQL